jgi:hypothetical protein
MSADQANLFSRQPQQGRGTLQERVESTVWGRRAISVFIAVILLALLIANLPPSRISRLTAPRVNPVMDAVGLSQGWYLFAPDPSPNTVRLVAVISFADGSTRTWTPPRLDPWIGTYRDYHWRGFDAAAQLQLRGAVWPELARWLAEKHQRADGPRVREISFYRGIARSPAPGSDAEPKWRLQKLHTFYPLIG